MAAVGARRGDDPRLLDRIARARVIAREAHRAGGIDLDQQAGRQLVAVGEQPRRDRFDILVRHPQILHGTHVHGRERGLHDGVLDVDGVVRMPAEHDGLRVCRKQILQPGVCPVALRRDRSGDGGVRHQEDVFAVIVRVALDRLQRVFQPADRFIGVSRALVCAFDGEEVVAADLYMTVRGRPGAVLVQIRAIEPLAQRVIEQRGVRAAGAVVVAQTEHERQIVRQQLGESVTHGGDLPRGRAAVHHAVGDVASAEQAVQPPAGRCGQCAVGGGDVRAVVRIGDAAERQHAVLGVELHRLGCRFGCQIQRAQHGDAVAVLHQSFQFAQCGVARFQFLQTAQRFFVAADRAEPVDRPRDRIRRSAVLGGDRGGAQRVAVMDRQHVHRERAAGVRADHGEIAVPPIRPVGGIARDRRGGRAATAHVIDRHRHRPRIVHGKSDPAAVGAQLAHGRLAGKQRRAAVLGIRGHVAGVRVDPEHQVLLSVVPDHAALVAERVAEVQAEPVVVDGIAQPADRVDHHVQAVDRHRLAPIVEPKARRACAFVVQMDVSVGVRGQQAVAQGRLAGVARPVDDPSGRVGDEVCRRRRIVGDVVGKGIGVGGAGQRRAAERTGKAYGRQQDGQQALAVLGFDVLHSFSPFAFAAVLSVARRKGKK